jgi:hypothetical protein
VGGGKFMDACVESVSFVEVSSVLLASGVMKKDVYGTGSLYSYQSLWVLSICIE